VKPFFLNERFEVFNEKFSVKKLLDKKSEEEKATGKKVFRVVGFES